MTIKQLLRKLEEEKYDKTHFDVVITTGDEVFPITDISLDEEKHQLVLSLDGEEESDS